MSCCPLARSFHCIAEASPHLLTGPPLQSSLCLCVCVCVCGSLSLSLFVCICLCLPRISLQDQGMISFLSEILFQKMSFTFNEMFHCPKSKFGRRFSTFNVQRETERDTEKERETQGQRHRERERVLGRQEVYLESVISIKSSRFLLCWVGSCMHNQQKHSFTCGVRGVT
jgi:hypothetical protein